PRRRGRARTVGRHEEPALPARAPQRALRGADLRLVRLRDAAWRDALARDRGAARARRRTAARPRGHAAREITPPHGAFSLHYVERATGMGKNERMRRLY